MIEFDFERDVENMLPKLPRDQNGFKMDQKQRTIVCRHWLLGLCYKGEQCSHLHRLDKSKMPPCKHGNLCKIKNCPLKHVAEEELEECIFYKQGFCYNGPKCGRRHVRRTPDECPVEGDFENNFKPHYNQDGKKVKTTHAPNDNFKVTLCTHWLLSGSCPFDTSCHYAHGEEQLNDGFQPNMEFLQDANVYDPTAGKMDVPLKLPFPSTDRISYFIFQSPDLRSLAVSKRRGCWAIPSRMVGEVNNAIRTAGHVIAYMCVRSLRGIYGVVQLTNPIPEMMPGLGPAMSPEFPVTWIRTLRVSLRTVAQLKLGMSGMFVGRSSADGRFDNKVGLDILLTAFRKPEWDWYQELGQAEHGMRVVDPKATTAASGETTTTTTTTGTTSIGVDGLGEYYPANGVAAARNPSVPPDALFAPDWIERAALIPAEKYEKGGRAGTGPGGAMSAGMGISAANLPPIPDFYAGDSPGFVFCAITPVIEEMLARNLFGLPLHMQDAQIHPNVPLFIFDSMTQMLLGIFYADSPTSLNIEPTAFVQWQGLGPGGGSPLPVQLRFRLIIEIPPTPVQDPELLAALGAHAATLGGPLGVTETRAVANLLAKRVVVNQMMASGMMGGLSSGGGGMAGALTTGGGSKGGGAGDSGQYYQPPFKFTDTVPIEIQGSLYEMPPPLFVSWTNLARKVPYAFGYVGWVRDFAKAPITPNYRSLSTLMSLQILKNCCNELSNVCVSMLSSVGMK